MGDRCNLPGKVSLGGGGDPLPGPHSEDLRSSRVRFRSHSEDLRVSRTPAVPAVVPPWRYPPRSTTQGQPRTKQVWVTPKSPPSVSRSLMHGFRGDIATHCPRPRGGGGGRRPGGVGVTGRTLRVETGEGETPSPSAPPQWRYSHGPLYLDLLSLRMSCQPQRTLPLASLLPISRSRSSLQHRVQRYPHAIRARFRD